LYRDDAPMHDRLLLLVSALAVAALVVAGAAFARDATVSPATQAAPTETACQQFHDLDAGSDPSALRLYGQLAPSEQSGALTPVVGSFLDRCLHGG
jgi:hypothetical protein